ncbi:MAG: 6-phosphofructokinase, partial [Ignavibacteriae bacterium]|nr:6-phosphofructokinase [Ignavibacteriota bacterium]
MKCIGILTGGGDVPGLNPCVKAVVVRAVDAGYEVLGIRRGWGGLVHYNPDNPEESGELILPLTKANTRTIDRSGGTFLHTSRTNPARVKNKDMPAFLTRQGQRPSTGGRTDVTPHVLRVLGHLGIDALITIGGDDTMFSASRVGAEAKGQIKVAHVPKTIDNDL